MDQGFVLASSHDLINLFLLSDISCDALYCHTCQRVAEGKINFDILFVLMFMLYSRLFARGEIFTD